MDILYNRWVRMTLKGEEISTTIALYPLYEGHSGGSDKKREDR